MRSSCVAVLVAGLFTAVPATVGAQMTGDRSANGSPTIPREYNGQSFNITPSYSLADAWAGNDLLKIKVTIQTVGRQALDLLGCDNCNSDSPLFFSNMNKPPQPDDPGTPSADRPWIRVYQLKAGIRSDIEPKEYEVTLRFASHSGSAANVPDATVTFSVYVGVREKGLLRVDNPPDLKPESCGKRHTFTLKLHNGFRDYTTQLQELRVDSLPSGLVSRIINVRMRGVSVSASDEGEPLVVRLDKTPAIPPARDDYMTVEVEMASMSWSTFVTGFGDDQKAIFAFRYDDGNERTITDFWPARPIVLQPSVGWLALAIGLGIGAGVLLMSAWKLLKYEGAFWSKVRLAATTVVIGLITAILAITGELNIAAFNVRASTDKPLMLFVLGLVATVLGTPLLRKYFGLDKGAAGTTGGTP